MSIVALPQNVIAQINSSSLVTNLNQVIIELFKNSLDANCTKVEIGVDYSRGICIVEDNGLGILPTEFCETGGLGKAYHTSRQYDVESHGSRGNFLASISSIALLTISSRHHSYRSHNALCINYSMVLFRQLPAPSQHHLHFDHGTRVTVHNLFGNMPVRIKQRAIDLARRDRNRKEWDELLIGLARLLFPWTRTQISVIVRNKLSNHKVVLQTPILKTTEETLIPKICSILRQASVITIEDMTSWISVKTSTENLRITGAISLRPHTSKRCQFLSFGIKPISLEGSFLYDDINKSFCNSNFGNIEVVVEIEDEERRRRESDRRYKRSMYTSKELKCVKGIEKWPKFYLNISSEVVSKKSIDICAESDSWHYSGSLSVKIRELMKELIWNFLKENSFCPRTSCEKGSDKKRLSRSFVVNTLRQSETLSSMETELSSSTLSLAQGHRPIHNQFGSTIKLPCFNQNTQSFRLPYSSLSKAKLGVMTRASSMSELDFTTKLYEQAVAKQSFSTSLNNVKPIESRVSEDCVIRINDITEIQKASSATSSATSSSKPLSTPLPSVINETLTQSDATTLWKNSATQKKRIFSQRKGFLVAPRNPDLDTLSQKFCCQTISTKSLHNDPDSWIDRLLRSWNSPIYLPAEKLIPQVSLESCNIKDTGFSRGQLNNYANICGTNLDEMGAQLNGRISKQALKGSKFIAQVDKKFILIKIYSMEFNTDKTYQRPDELLVMIDQHAADERIRIESLLKELCTPVFKASKESLDSAPCYQVQSYFLAKPLSIIMPYNEIEHLSIYKDHFSSWGITYELPVTGLSTSPPTTDTTTTQKLTVLSLPSVIAERCQLQPSLLISLLRKEIWKLQDPNYHYLPASSTGITSGTPWLDRIHTCPVGILDLLNARACRSAIMFNDELSEEQCRVLVKRLAECSFPFQCAHGRPSMIPLVKLSSLDFFQKNPQEWDGVSNSSTTSLGTRFKNWKRLKDRDLVRHSHCQ